MSLRRLPPAGHSQGPLPPGPVSAVPSLVCVCGLPRTKVQDQTSKLAWLNWANSVFLSPCYCSFSRKALGIIENNADNGHALFLSGRSSVPQFLMYFLWQRPTCLLQNMHPWQKFVTWNVKIPRIPPSRIISVQDLFIQIFFFLCKHSVLFFPSVLSFRSFFLSPPFCSFPSASFPASGVSSFKNQKRKKEKKKKKPRFIK